MKQKNARVAIAIPTYRGEHNKCREAVQQMIAASQGRISRVLVESVAGSLVHQSRNELLAKITRRADFDYTHVLFVDDDAIPSADALIKLLQHGADAVSGIYVTRTMPPKLVAYDHSADGRYTHLSQLPTERLQRVAAVGAGFLLLSRRAIERLRDAYLNCEIERQLWTAPVGTTFDAIAQQRQARFAITGDAQLFEYMPDKNYAGALGEDFSFCRKLELCGVPLFIDRDVHVGHVGEFVYLPQDFVAHQEFAAKAASTPPA